MPELPDIVVYLDALEARVVGRRLRSAGREPGQKAGVGPRQVLATFEFEEGTLLFTEAGPKMRGSLHVEEALVRENHTLERILTAPRLISGVGNAYSDESLRAAPLSPLKLTRSLTADEISRLFEATRLDLTAWGRTAAPRGGGVFPREGDCLSSGVGGPRALRSAVPRLRRTVQHIVYATTRATTVQSARPAAGCWPIAHCRGC